jgi:NADH-quinone oxidoreductase subunit M
MEWFDTWALPVIVFLPLAGMLLLGLIPKEKENAVKGTALVGLAGHLRPLIAGDRSVRFRGRAYNTYQFEVNTNWISAINANFHMGVDGISLPLLVLSTFVVVLAIIYSWDHWEEPRNPRAFLMLTLLLATGMNGTFVALDLVLFFIFFEVVLLPMYFMIGIWGDKSPRKIPGFSRVVETRIYASIKFFLFTLFGSAFMLLGFLALYFRSGDFGERTFDIVELTNLGAAGFVHRHLRLPGLRRPVPRLRGQGADVAAPHLAARRPYCRPHCGVGAAGRHPPEARAPTASSASRSRSSPMRRCAGPR